jgi:hypothetical protein
LISCSLPALSFRQLKTKIERKPRDEERWVWGIPPGIRPRVRSIVIRSVIRSGIRPIVMSGVWPRIWSVVGSCVWPCVGAVVGSDGLSWPIMVHWISPAMSLTKSSMCRPCGGPGETGCGKKEDRHNRHKHCQSFCSFEFHRNTSSFRTT